MTVDPKNTSDCFVDATFFAGEEPTVTYRTGLVSYQESLVGGQFVGRGWNGSGFTNPESERLNPTKHATPQAFWLEVDGQLLHSHWTWKGFTQSQEARGLHVVVTLQHRLRPVTVQVHTLLDGTPVLTRWLEITNGAEQPAGMAACYPWSGVFQETAYDIDKPESPYEIGYFIDSHWGNEGDFEWRRLPYAGYRIDGRYRRDRHRQPFFVLKNDRTGEHWIGELAWSGGFAFEFDLDDGVDRKMSRLGFRLGPDGPAPQRVLAAGETVASPEVHLGLVVGDLDAAIQGLHDHLRASVLFIAPAGRAGLIEAGIGPEQEITPELVYHDMEACAKLGCELFFIDASWYARPNSHWWSTVGDWEVDRERFPEGLEPIRDRAHELGMLFGLWMDSERIGTESKVFQEHPEWLARRYDGKPELGGLIDLTNPACAQWMEDQIAGVIERYDLDFYRLDHNTGGLGMGQATEQGGFIESGYWRYYQALYGIYGRLRKRFPNVVFENCAGGGGRSDIGLVRYFNHTWVTDWQIAPRSFSITNGMTMCLPPEYVDRLGGMGQSTQRTAELDFQNRLPLFVHVTYGWPNLGPVENPVNSERVKHVLSLYKDFVRPIQTTGRMYHHTPDVTGYDPCGWGVLELASRDRTKAIAGLFRLSDPAEPEYVFRFRGIDIGRRYRVTFDNARETAELDGFTLVKVGVPVQLHAALTSELILVEAID
ncbi:MAG: alpha-galactosidase [Anaerolineae bacterium]